MKTTSRLTSLALNVYPSWWRERYEEEMVLVIQSLLDNGRSPFRVALNLIGSSLRTRLTGAGAPASCEVWAHRTQRSLSVATLPWFAIAPLAFIILQSNGEHGSFSGNFPPPPSRAGMFANALHWGMGYVILAYVVIALVGWRRLQRGLEGQHFQLGWSRLIKGSAMASIALVVSALFLGSHKSTSVLAEVLAYGGLGLLVISWFSMSAVVNQMLQLGELPVALLRTEVRLSAALAGLSGALTLLAVGNHVALSLQPTPLPGASYWAYGSSLGVLDVPLLIGFSLLTVISVLGAYAARRSYSRTLAFQVG